MPAPFRILFITSNRIGDAVLSSGILAQLIAAHPGAAVTVASGALPLPLFADVPGIERLYAIHKAKRGRHWLRLWRAMVGQRWNVVVDVRSALFAWTVRADKRLVCWSQKRREHRIEEFARLLHLPSPPTPTLWVSAEREARAHSRLGDGPLLALGPTANFTGKQWPADRFAEAALRLTAADGILPGARVAVFGAAHERPMAEPLLTALPPERVLDFIGTPDLLDAFALLRRCSLYIGNDSGLMHMAVAARIPTLGLFGPSPEWRYGPTGPLSALVRTPESFEELARERASNLPQRASLLDRLTTETVVEGAESLWLRIYAGDSPGSIS